MANNVTITQGTGTTVATDEVAGVHYQAVKLVSGTEDSIDRIGGDATNGLDVDVTRITPGTAATNLGKAEDAAHASGDVGVMILGVRQDTLSTLSGTDGDYTPISMNANGAVYVATVNSRDRTTDNIGVAMQTDAIMNDTTVLTPQFAAIDVGASGDNTIVTAVVGRNIRVLGYVLVATGAVTVRFEDGASGTALTGQMSLAANSVVSVPFNPVGWFETSDNTLLNLELGSAVGVEGHLVYVEV